MEALTTRAGSQLRYRDEGAGDDALLLVHGWCSSGRAWERTAPAFARRGRVVRVDLRGHGASEAPPRGGYLWGDFADDLEDLVVALGLARIVAVGHSMGSPVSLELAGRLPRAVAGVVAVDGLSGLGLASGRAATHPWVAALTPTSTAATRRRLVETFLPAAARGRRIVAGDAARADPGAALAAYRDAVVTGSPRAAWRERDHPFLYVAASRSRRSAADVRAVIPRAEFGQVVNSGHYVQFDAAAQLHAMLDRFLAGIP
ncbi:MAG: alpha/beta hydrolase [Chloroflexi bacterium]|nr:alpha/beta hydrolase [Chloroflexota bacterium]